MNFLIDVHLPISLSKFLDGQPQCTAIHVNQILQKWNTPDGEICRYADDNNLVVVSKDSDFKNSFFVKKTPRKVVRIILGNISNKEMVAIFEKYLPFLLKLEEEPDFYIELSKEQIMIIN